MKPPKVTISKVMLEEIVATLLFYRNGAHYRIQDGKKGTKPIDDDLGHKALNTLDRLYLDLTNDKKEVNQ